MNNKNREFLPVRNHPDVLKVKKNGEKTSSFIKQHNGENVDGNIEKENAGYAKLKKVGLKVPRSRLFPDKSKLVIKEAGTPLDQIIFNNPEVAFSAFESALENLLNVWEKTKEKLDETKLERNYTTGSIATLDKILTTKSINTRKRICINGVNYPSLQETLDSCKNNLLDKKDELMVVSHGDEYFSNITAEKNKDGAFTGQHNFIDPRDVGFYSLSAVLNIIWGQTLLHNFKFSHTIKEEDEEIKIDYNIVPEQREIYEKFSSIMVNFLETVAKKLNTEVSLLNEYMFCNLARTLNDDTYKEKYRTKIGPSKIGFFSVAMEMFYKKYNTTHRGQ